MFHYKDLEFNTHPDVYDPAEDTYLILDVLDFNSNDKIFEIGAGCGIIGLYCAKKGADVVCSDINPFSTDLVRENYERNKDKIKGSIDIRQGDLFSVLQSKEKFDLIIFNPPYLPSKKEDLTGGWFDKAVDGGIDGLSAINRFIDGLSKHLEKGGRSYFIFSSLSDRKKLEKIISKNNFKSEVLMSNKFIGETLDVYLLKK